MKIGHVKIIVLYGKYSTVVGSNQVSQDVLFCDIAALTASTIRIARSPTASMTSPPPSGSITLLQDVYGETGSADV